jgi:hypothetical protein
MRHSMRTMRHGNLHDLCMQMVIAFGVLVCAAPCLTAETLCVNAGGRSGCKTTISAALSAASAGDTIQVAPGTYNE